MTKTTAAIEARRLGMRYGHRWALAECTLTIPAGHVAGLVGPNGAGKTTLISLATGLAKRPELLILDEPIASLDPLARREFLQVLMNATAEQELSVVISSHQIGDLERVSDYVIVLVDSRVRIDGEVDSLLATHHLLTGPRRDTASLPASQQVISESHRGRQSTFLVRSSEPIIDPAWTVEPVSLEDLVLAYMGHDSAEAADIRMLEAKR